MAIAASEARKNLFPLIEKVNDDRTPIEITSRRGDAVLLSRADYEAPEETAHLLRVPANAKRLLESLQQARAGERHEHDLGAVRLVFTPHGWGDYTYWLTADRTTLERINRLIEDSRRDPTSGIGKPEPLRHLLAGTWTRRITEEHRLVYLVYLVDGDDLVILQARFHYTQTNETAAIAVGRSTALGRRSHARGHPRRNVRHIRLARCRGEH